MTTFSADLKKRMAVAASADLKKQVAVVAALAAVGSIVVACGASTPAQSTATVERGSVSVKVSASGALSSVQSQNLGFPKAAQLTEIDVHVGDVVRAGQVLARLDPFAFQQQLNQQQAQLQNQQAQLNRIINGNTVGQAQRSYDQAHKIVDSTQDNVDAQMKLDDTTIKRTQDSQDLAGRQRDQAQRNLSFCRTHSAPGPMGVPPGTAVGGPLPTPPIGSGGSFGGLPGVGVPAPTFGHRHRDGQLGGNPRSYYSAGEGGADPCAMQVQAHEQSRTAYLTAKTQADQAKKQKNVDKTQGDVSIQNAKQSLITAQNSRELAGTDKPANVAAQQALVDNARAAVALAQRDLDNTVLYAPVAGTVGAINGVVNEYVGAETGLTSQAPGTSAAIPGVGAAATSSQNQISVSTNGSRNGGTFMVLNNVDSFQVVVPFEESDAVRITPNLPVEVTFEAIPDLVRDGRVVAVAPGGTDIAGVTNYYATVVLTDIDPRLRDGQTAQVGVLTSSKDNVLVVPNNAVLRLGGRSFVSVPGPDGKPRDVPFQAGLVDEDKTEVVSGLSEGQQILLMRPQSGPGNGTRGGLGRGGG
jgi:HlyD family secretion protein